MNWINRENVLEIMKAKISEPDKVELIKSLFSFPDPNPNWQTTNENIMGQTEDEFWNKVDGEE